MTNPLTLFVQSCSDAVSIEATAFEKLEKDFGEWYKNRCQLSEDQQKSFQDVVSPVMDWMAKNCHPHSKIIIESNIAELLEGVSVVNTDEHSTD